MNIIVPVDFTPISLNAAQFAARMLTGQYDVTMILYHAYEDEKAEVVIKQQLRDLKDRLLDDSIVKIETMAECSSDFIESLERKVRHFDADLVVMAITEKSRLEQVINASNSL